MIAAPAPLERERAKDQWVVASHAQSLLDLKKKKNGVVLFSSVQEKEKEVMQAHRNREIWFMS